MWSKLRTRRAAKVWTASDIITQICNQNFWALVIASCASGAALPSISCVKSWRTSSRCCRSLCSHTFSTRYLPTVRKSNLVFTLSEITFSLQTIYVNEKSSQYFVVFETWTLHSPACTHFVWLMDSNFLIQRHHPSNANEMSQLKLREVLRENNWRQPETNKNCNVSISSRRDSEIQISVKMS